MIVIKNPKTKEDFKAYYQLRYRILREPLGMPHGTEKDDYEPISHHFMAVDDTNGELLGVVKLFEKAPGIGQFSHMGVLETHQRKGVGKLLIDTIEKDARSQGFKTVGIMTRVTATSFYERCGYQIKGIPSPGAGRLQSVWMEKTLE